MTDRMTMAEFIKSAGLAMTCKPIDHNPNMIDADPRMSHWVCKIKRPSTKGQLTVPFSMGSGLSGAPTLAMVLDCLASDAGGVESCAGNFNDWCGEYGYDTDSRKAERAFKICERQAANLKRLLGEATYETLLYSTDRE